MAKKTRAQTEPERDGTDEAVSIIKLRLTPEEARRVRVAAAIEGKRPGAFAADSVLEVAKRVIAKGLG